MKLVPQAARRWDVSTRESSTWSWYSFPSAGLLDNNTSISYKLVSSASINAEHTQLITTKQVLVDYVPHATSPLFNCTHESLDLGERRPTLIFELRRLCRFTHPASLPHSGKLKRMNANNYRSGWRENKSKRQSGASCKAKHSTVRSLPTLCRSKPHRSSKPLCGIRKSGKFAKSTRSGKIFPNFDDLC